MMVYGGGIKYVGTKRRKSYRENALFTHKMFTTRKLFDRNG